MIRFKYLKRILLLLLLIGAVLSFVYWQKCQQGIDAFNGFHAASILPPVAVLHDRVPIVHADEGNKLFFESFSESPKAESEWGELWMRISGAVMKSYVDARSDGSRCLQISSTDSSDWSYQRDQLVAVNPGEVYSFEGDIRQQGAMVADMSVILYDAQQQVISWYHGCIEGTKQNVWEHCVRSFIVPRGVAYIRFRITGRGIGSAWFDNISLLKEKRNFSQTQTVCNVENGVIRLTLDLDDSKMQVIDSRNGIVHEAKIDSKKYFVVFEKGKISDTQLGVRFIDHITGSEYKALFELKHNSAEIVCTIDGDVSASLSNIAFPPVFLIQKEHYIILPLQEGLCIPLSALGTVFPNELRYGGAFPMPWVGVTGNDAGWLMLLETPYDGCILKATDPPSQENLRIQWEGQKGLFGYARQMRYVFFNEGGYVAQAKWYRSFVAERGLLELLRDKDNDRKKNIDKLVGALNVWFFDPQQIFLAKEFKKIGIDKALFSFVQDSKDIETIGSYGYLTSEYDMYQDLFNPADRKSVLGHLWPDALVWDQKNDWVRWWSIKKEGKDVYGGLVCSPLGVKAAREFMPEEVKKGYTARFIDTTTCSPFRECYNPKHPITRTEDVQYKMELLSFCSRNLQIVTGSENGVDCAVPYCDYFEGMMSIGKGRLPDSGRDVTKVAYVEPTADFLTYQVGVQYRIPLWELVYHDCVVSTWYWGDASNRIPELWWRKDLFNILYGNMPLWAIRDWYHWKQYRDRFIECYNNVCPVFGKVGFEEMLSHRFVTDDHNVQETTFSNEVRVVVNFGEKDYMLTDSLNVVVKAHGFVVLEEGVVWKQGVCTTN